MLENIIALCPDELWDKKAAGFVFWQQLVHALAGAHCWMREEKPEVSSFLTFNGKNIYPELEHDPEITLTKADVKQLCDETKAAAEKWFEGKNDDWLEKPLFETFTNFDNTTTQLRHIMYHVGHFDAVLREQGIKTGEYLDYWG